jgi:hypothetical protein
MLKLVRFACQIESEAHAAEDWLLAAAACVTIPHFARILPGLRLTKLALNRRYIAHSPHQRRQLRVPVRMSNSALAYRCKWRRRAAANRIRGDLHGSRKITPEIAVSW